LYSARRQARDREIETYPCKTGSIKKLRTSRFFVKLHHHLRRNSHSPDRGSNNSRQIAGNAHRSRVSRTVIPASVDDVFPQLTCVIRPVISPPFLEESFCTVPVLLHPEILRDPIFAPERQRIAAQSRCLVWRSSSTNKNLLWDGQSAVITPCSIGSDASLLLQRLPAQDVRLHGRVTSRKKVLSRTSARSLTLTSSERTCRGVDDHPAAYRSPTSAEAGCRTSRGSCPPGHQHLPAQLPASQKRCAPRRILRDEQWKSLPDAIPSTSTTALARLAAI